MSLCLSYSERDIKCLVVPTIKKAIKSYGPRAPKDQSIACVDPDATSYLLPFERIPWLSAAGGQDGHIDHGFSDSLIDIVAAALFSALR